MEFFSATENHTFQIMVNILLFLRIHKIIFSFPTKMLFFALLCFASIVHDAELISLFNIDSVGPFTSTANVYALCCVAVRLMHAQTECVFVCMCVSALYSRKLVHTTAEALPLLLKGDI